MPESQPPDPAPQAQPHISWDNAPSTATPPRAPQKRSRNRYGLHSVLLLATFVTTTLAGAEHVTNRHWLGAPPGQAATLADFWKGIPYSLSFLAFLLTHEFGHYFAARWHKVRTSLPFAIPVFIPVPGVFNIGSFGAVIRIRDRPDSTRKYFDIGVAGPLAGFVVALGLLVYGFLTLPPLDYLYEMNPLYRELGHVPTLRELLEINVGHGNGQLFVVGHNLLYDGLAYLLADPARMPSQAEILHYPFLFAGFLTLFFTALNLLPIGQLDGGHVTYGLFGRRIAGIVSRATVLLLIVYGGTGIVNVQDFYAPGFSFGVWGMLVGIYLLFLFFVISRILPDVRHTALAVGAVLLLQQLVVWVAPTQSVYPLWLLYAFLAVRVIRLDHPVALVEAPLSRGRKAIGWLALVIFVLCFTPEPLSFLGPEDLERLPPDPPPVQQVWQAPQPVTTPVRRFSPVARFSSVARFSPVARFS